MKLLKSLSVGLSIGYVITVGMMLLWLGWNEITAQLFVWCIISGFYGVTAMVFQWNKLNPLTASLVHYVLCLGGTMIPITLFYQGLAGMVILNFTVIYAIIYVVMWTKERKEVKEINKKLGST